MRERFEEIGERVYRQNIDCPVNGLDGYQLASFIHEEAGELVEAVNTEDPMKVASEMGDVLYLLYRMSHLTGIDLLDAVELKLIRNQVKYNNQLSCEQGKDIYKRLGGDDAFFNAYSETMEGGV